MSVRKRRWTTRRGEGKEAWVVDYVDQQGRRVLKTFVRKKEADVFAGAASVEVREGTHVADSASVTVKKAGELWLESAAAADLERTTLDQYRQHLRLHIEPLIGPTKLSQLMLRQFAPSKTGCARAATTRKNVRPRWSNTWSVASARC